MLKRLFNKILTYFEINRIPNSENKIFLTFDDGPEEGITEFVIQELERYGFHATFFCRGDNAEKYPNLINMLREKGHAIGNHTFSHLHAFEVSSKSYINDVNNADKILKTSLFRPPHGSLTLSTWFYLRKYNIFFWALNSEDSSLAQFNGQDAINKLKNNTRTGDVVLFHFCLRHEQETRQILPVYLSWLHEQGYNCEKIEI